MSGESCGGGAALRERRSFSSRARTKAVTGSTRRCAPPERRSAMAEGRLGRRLEVRSPSRSPLRSSNKSEACQCLGPASDDFLAVVGVLRLKATPATFRPQFHSPRHLFHQPMLRRSITKPIQINALNLVGKIGQPSRSGENPPIRREKALPFRPCTIKVSGEKPANARESPSPTRAESMFA